jgi:hypothetical protein
MRKLRFPDFTLVLTIIFVILKLTSVIKWSWWWIFSPMIISFILYFIVVFVVLALLNSLKK